MKNVLTQKDLYDVAVSLFGKDSQITCGIQNPGSLTCQDDVATLMRYAENEMIKKMKKAKKFTFEVKRWINALEASCIDGKIY